MGEKHRELLTVPKITKTMKRGEYTDIEESTDVQAIKAGLDMAYKLKGKYAPEKVAGDLIVKVDNSLADKYVLTPKPKTNSKTTE